MLEVQVTFSIEEIKKQYRKLSKKYHPDTGGTEEQFINLQKSYDWLIKNHKQKQSEVDWGFQSFTKGVNTEFLKSKNKEFVIQAVKINQSHNIYVNKETLTEGGVVFISDPYRTNFPEIRITVPENSKEGFIAKIKLGGPDFIKFVLKRKSDGSF